MASYRSIFFLLPACLLFACGPSKKTTQVQGGDIVIGSDTDNPPPPPRTVDSSKVRYYAIQIKYAHYLNTEPGQIQNFKLYGFIDQWLSTPYLWGGTDERGIDCSAFMQRLLAQVYNINIPRTSVQQFFDDWIDRFGSTQYLSEGDLVFFKTMDDKLISHVGMYLQNRMFVNSSSSKGVSIASLDDPYWKRRFVAAGRIKTSQPTVQK
jgi:murein DD-endopeptidase / murein LD-carboxypeptidase